MRSRPGELSSLGIPVTDAREQNARMQNIVPPSTRVIMEDLPLLTPPAASIASPAVEEDGEEREDEESRDEPKKSVELPSVTQEV